jgi:hypothetical protein
MLVAAVVAIALAAVALPCLAFAMRPGSEATARSREPSRHELRGVTSQLRIAVRGFVRVEIVLKAQPLAAAAARRQPQLTIDPSLARRRLLRRLSPLFTARVAQSEQEERNRALRSLNPAALTAARAQHPLMDAIRMAGGHVIGTDPLLNSITALVPRSMLARLGTRNDVQAIEPAPRGAPLTLIAPTEAVGAPAWWSAGFTGGTGSADLEPANLAIVGDPIYWGHPAFAGVSFETPPGAQLIDPNGGLHGTGVASMAVSQGASGCPMCQPSDVQQKGIAPGVSRVLDSWGAASEWAWSTGQPYSYYDTASDQYEIEPGAAAPAQVMSYSRGTSESADDSADSQVLDSYVNGLGVTAAIAAGNSGPTAGSIDEPADAYNVIAVGGFCCGANATDRSNDSVFSWSSEGPTIGGRKKPDLVAAGSADVADSLFNTDGTLWRYATGTSFAAPQVAGAATLLAGAGIVDPKVVKALLVDSALEGRATPTGSMGTQVGWQPDWGWGELNLTDALAQRFNYEADSVPSNGVRFYRATAAAAGDRATLVWNRRVTPCFQDGCAYQTAPYSAWHTYTLSKLALTELDASTGDVQAVSDSQVDNVQQVRSPNAGQVIYKVTAGAVDGLPAEPFALAAKNPLTPLVTPQPTTSIRLSDTGFTHPGDAVTVTADVANPSPDLTAENATVALYVPPGVKIVSGSPTASLGTLGTRGSGSDTATASWAVEGTTDGVKQLTATTSASRYGSTFASSAAGAFAVDSTPPSAALAVPSGGSVSPEIPLSWGATDSGSGVAAFDVAVSVDGGPLTPWLLGTTQTTAVYAGAPGHVYRFAVRATDRLGNVGGFIVSGPVAVASAVRGGGGRRTAARRDARLSLTEVRRRGSALSVVGALDHAAHGFVRITWSARRGHRVYRVSRRLRVRHGRFSAVVHLPVVASRSTTLTIAFSGDPRFASATRRVTIRSH